MGEVELDLGTERARGRGEIVRSGIIPHGGKRLQIYELDDDGLRLCRRAEMGAKGVGEAPG